MTRILLVRHGETDWNRIGLYQGATDVPLNARGRRQAATLAAALRAEPIAAIYTSPLGRARSTASAVAGRRRVPVHVIPELRELSYGLWQGKSADWSRRQHPILEHRWRTDPWTVRFPGGETLDDVRDRAAAALEWIARAHADDTIVLCGHGHLNRVLLIHALGWAPSRFWRIAQPNGAVRVLQGRGGGNWRLAQSRPLGNAPGV